MQSTPRAHIICEKTILEKDPFRYIDKQLAQAYSLPMKHDQLRSIAHNIADSFASGIGLPIGCHATDVFGEAAKSPGGFMTVDFLRGAIVAGCASASLAKAVSLYRDVLADMCAMHGVSVRSFRTLTARYSTTRLQQTVVVRIEDSEGRCSADEYVGVPLRRIKTVDIAGRVRTLRKPKRE